MGAIIQTPLNTSITTSTWKAITLNSGQSCSSIVARTRGATGNTGFKASDSSGGTTYFTLSAGETLEMDINGADGTTLFYAQSTGADDTLEVIIVRG